METFSVILLILALIVSATVVVKILSAPVKLAFKLLLNALSGFLLLLLANLISGFFDFSIHINWISCLISGVFGIPGVILMVVIALLL